MCLLYVECQHQTPVSPDNNSPALIGLWHMTGGREELRDVEIFCQTWRIPFPGPDLEQWWWWWQVGGGITSLSLPAQLRNSLGSWQCVGLTDCSAGSCPPLPPPFHWWLHLMRCALSGMCDSACLVAPCKQRLSTEAPPVLCDSLAWCCVHVLGPSAWSILSRIFVWVVGAMSLKCGGVIPQVLPA